MKNKEDLKKELIKIDHKSYGMYKTLGDSYSYGNYILHIDHVQGDPFASPSKSSVFIPLQRAAYPSGYFDAPHKQTALEDYLVRQFCQEIAKYNFKAKGSGKSGLIATAIQGLRFSAGQPVNAVLRA